MKENRRFRRFNTLLQSRYTAVKGCATIYSQSLIEDISPGGLCATLSSIIKPKDEMLVDIASPVNDVIVALVSVLWIKPFEASIHNTCGMKFLWISSSDKLNDCINNIKGEEAA